MKIKTILIIIAITLIGYILYVIPLKQPEIELTQEIEKAIETPHKLSKPDLTITNQRNKEITNFSCKKIKIIVWQGKLPIKLRGEIFFEKEKNFRMKIQSLVDYEGDIGSNQEVFWFWFKRMKPSALHFAKHEDLQKTKLRTPFNPYWIMQTLGFNEITLNESSKILETSENWLIEDITKDSNNKTTLKITFLDKKFGRIKGYVLQDKQKTIAASVILEYQDMIIPKKILYAWYEENIFMLLEFEEYETNRVIDPKMWIMPSSNKIIDMGIE